MPHSYSESILLFFYHYKNATSASPMAKYMKGQFEFLGIPSPRRKFLLKEFILSNGLPTKEELSRVMKDLWESPYREMQYVAIDTWDKMRKHLVPNDIKLIEYLIVHKSWWDTVDFLASHAAADFFKKFPAEMRPVTSRWIHSNNMWLQRSAILFQVHYKDKTDQKLLYQYIAQQCSSKEFFIQKAIGTALRQYAKIAPKSVYHFVSSTDLAPLSKREALKHIG